MPVFEDRNDVTYGLDGIPLNPSKIDTLEALVENQMGHEYEVIKNVRLRSKKNVVLHLVLKSIHSQQPVSFIAKAFVTGNYDLELKLLEQSWKSGLSVPLIIAAEGGVILLDYIEGELLVDRINRTFEMQIIDGLAKWYYDFHITHHLLKGDPRLRNFIVCNDTLFGLDLEEVREGHWMASIGGVAASLLDTDPINDPRKRNLAWHLLDQYLLLLDTERTKDIEQEFVITISETLKQTAKWRKSEVISDLASQIQKKGLPIE